VGSVLTPWRDVRDGKSLLVIKGKSVDFLSASVIPPMKLTAQEI